MRIEALVLLGVAIFFGIVGAVYWFTSYEDGGTMMLVGTCLLGLLPGSYYYWWHRRMGDRPEDRDDATLEDGAGQIATFPSSSIWPFVLGMGAGPGTRKMAAITPRKAEIWPHRLPHSEFLDRKSVV